MKVLSRDFTTKEKVLLLILALIIIVIAYYLFVYQPVNDGIQKAEATKQELNIELEAVNARVEKLQKMKEEIDNVTENGTLKSMPSYNNSKNVNKLLNDIIGNLEFTIGFKEVTRNGDQIRRYVSLQFIAYDEQTVRDVLSALSNSEYRCLLNDIQCNFKIMNEKNVYTVNTNLVFFETMVGGTPDAGLPVEEQA